MASRQPRAIAYAVYVPVGTGPPWKTQAPDTRCFPAGTVCAMPSRLALGAGVALLVLAGHRGLDTSSRKKYAWLTKPSGSGDDDSDSSWAPEPEPATGPRKLLFLWSMQPTACLRCPRYLHCPRHPPTLFQQL
jgi:hypothetical protein